MTLTSKQRAFLNNDPQPQNRLSKLGKMGSMTKSKTSVRQALDARELIKVTLLQNTDEETSMK
ncbi:MAG: YhbY family RNA-binding protein [Streptococcus sp.]